MRAGRAAPWRTVATAVVLTSAFWVAVGAWLLNGQAGQERRPNTENGAQEPADAAAASGGLVSGLVGGGRPAASSRTPSTAGSGEVAGGSRLLIPVAGIKAETLVDTFAQARASGERRHDAIDIPAPHGTPVLAAAPGRIEKLYRSEDGGNTVYIRSPDRRIIYYYAHLDGYEPSLREGDQARRGQRLGTVGSTGNAAPDAPHLHFAMWQADPKLGWHQEEAPAINPYPLLKNAVNGN